MDDKCFSTRDMYLAGCLMSEGTKYLRADRTDPRKILFVFEDSGSGDIARVQEQWANATLVVSATQFCDALRRLKSVIHAEI